MNFEFRGKHNLKGYIFDEHPKYTDELFAESGQTFKKHVKHDMENGKKLASKLSPNVQDYIKKDNKRLQYLYNHVGPSNVYDVHEEDSKPGMLEALTSNELKDRAKHLAPDDKKLRDLVNGKPPVSKPNQLVNYLNQKGTKYSKSLGVYTGGQMIHHVKDEIVHAEKSYKRDSQPHTTKIGDMKYYEQPDEFQASNGQPTPD